ncbi:hypothetical protein O9992_28480 [Vibrio lentus]|nr:hypothetical protein [Vibrio lentus]
MLRGASRTIDSVECCTQNYICPMRRVGVEAAQIFRNSFESWVFNADGSSELLTKRHGVIYLDGAGRNLEIRAQSAAFRGDSISDSQSRLRLVASRG